MDNGHTLCRRTTCMFGADGSNRQFRCLTEKTVKLGKSDVDWRSQDNSWGSLRSAEVRAVLRLL